jgi:hypothetical protein
MQVICVGDKRSNNGMSACLCEPAPPQTPSVLRSLADAGERLAPDLLAGLVSQEDSWTLLHAASFNGHSEVVDRLIVARAMVDAADKVLPRTRPRHLRARITTAASRQHYMRAFNLRLTPALLMRGRACTTRLTRVQVSSDGRVLLPRQPRYPPAPRTSCM